MIVQTPARVRGAAGGRPVRPLALAPRPPAPRDPPGSRRGSEPAPSSRSRSSRRGRPGRPRARSEPAAARTRTTARSSGTVRPTATLKTTATARWRPTARSRRTGTWRPMVTSTATARRSARQMRTAMPMGTARARSGAPTGPVNRSIENEPPVPENALDLDRVRAGDRRHEGQASPGGRRRSCPRTGTCSGSRSGSTGSTARRRGRGRCPTGGSRRAGRGRTGTYGVPSVVIVAAIGVPRSACDSVNVVT